MCVCVRERDYNVPGRFFRGNREASFSEKKIKKKERKLLLKERRRITCGSECLLTLLHRPPEAEAEAGGCCWP